MDGAAAGACTAALEVRSDNYKQYRNMKFEVDAIKSNLRKLLGEKVYRDLTFYYRNPERAPQDLFREATASLRVLPDFIIVGAMKSGTTSLFHYLAAHPQVVAPQHKEIHFFDNQYEKGENWYRRHFPLRTTMRLKENAITGESSPYYMLHPLAPERMKEVVPEAKLIFLLRDPVERAISHYFFMRRFGEEDRSFEEAVRESHSSVKKEESKIKKGEKGKSWTHQMYYYISKVKYHEQIKKYEKKFGKENIKLLDSKKFLVKTRKVYMDVCNFLRIEKQIDVKFERKNKGANKKEISQKGKKFAKEKLKMDMENLEKKYKISS